MFGLCEGFCCSLCCRVFFCFVLFRGGVVFYCFFLSIIMLSVHVVNFYFSSLFSWGMCAHICMYSYKYTLPHAGSLYYVFVEEKWDVAWLESNLALKCSRHCPCYCAACLFMAVFVLWRWKKSLKFHTENNLVKVYFHLMYLIGRRNRDYNWL